MDEIVIGQVSGVVGCDGRIRVRSFADPQENISQFKQWLIGETKTPYSLLKSQQASPGIIARLEGINDRDQALALLNQRIMVNKLWLARLPENDYYWFELVGLNVINQQGKLLGKVKKLTETGANDVLVVESDKKRCLIPYVKDNVIQQVDLSNQQITVDWKEDWCDEN